MGSSLKGMISRLILLIVSSLIPSVFPALSVEKYLNEIPPLELSYHFYGDSEADTLTSTNASKFSYIPFR
jgi:hypothetical protein